MKTIKIILIIFMLFSTTSIIKSTKTEKINIYDYELVKGWVDYYSHEYKIPKNVVYNILKIETRWKNKDTTYLASQEGDGKIHKKTKKIIPGTGKSFGPGQIQLLTARGIWKDTTITREYLLKNIQFNIETMCKILKADYMYFSFIDNKEIRWKYTLTVYNTGLPNFEKNNRTINNYAKIVYSKSF